MSRHITGFGTKVKFTVVAPAVTLELEEIDVTPQGVQGNEKIEQTSNRNVKHKSYKPGDLSEITDGSFTCYYDTDQWDDIKSIINIEGALEVLFKNGDKIDDTAAWLVSAIPTGQTIGNRPTMDCVFSSEGEDSSGSETQTVTTT